MICTNVYFIKKDNISLLGNQEKILKHVKKMPGHTQSQITYRLDIAQSTVKYHLLQLIKKNKIYSEKLFKIHYFPVGISDKIKIKTCIESNNNLNDIYKNLTKKYDITRNFINLQCFEEHGIKKITSIIFTWSY